MIYLDSPGLRGPAGEPPRHASLEDAAGLERETEIEGNGDHAIARVTQTGRIAIRIVGGADGSGDPGRGDGLGFGDFVNFRTPL